MKTLLRVLAAFAVACVAGLAAAFGFGWHPYSPQMWALTTVVFVLALAAVGAAVGRERA